MRHTSDALHLMEERPVSRTLERTRAYKHVAFVDDEREIGNSIIVTLVDNYYFNDDPGCGVRGFDTATEAFRACSPSNVYFEEKK